jgi:hypothetical protein
MTVSMRVHENKTLVIQWILKDGSVYYKKYTVPPKATREYKEEKE